MRGEIAGYKTPGYKTNLGIRPENRHLRTLNLTFYKTIKEIIQWFPFHFSPRLMTSVRFAFVGEHPLQFHSLSHILSLQFINLVS